MPFRAHRRPGLPRRRDGRPPSRRRPCSGLEGRGGPRGRERQRSPIPEDPARSRRCPLHDDASRVPAPVAPAGRPVRHGPALWSTDRVGRSWVARRDADLRPRVRIRVGPVFRSAAEPRAAPEGELPAGPRRIGPRCPVHSPGSLRSDRRRRRRGEKPCCHSGPVRTARRDGVARRRGSPAVAGRRRTDDRPRGAADHHSLGDPHRGAADLDRKGGHRVSSTVRRTTADHHHALAALNTTAGRRHALAALNTTAGRRHAECDPQMPDDHHLDEDAHRTRDGPRGSSTGLRTTAGRHPDAADPRTKGARHGHPTHRCTRVGRHRVVVGPGSRDAHHEPPTRRRRTVDHRHGADDLCRTADHHHAAAVPGNRDAHRVPAARRHTAAGHHHVGGDRRRTVDHLPDEGDHHTRDGRCADPIGRHRTADRPPDAGDRRTTVDQRPDAGGRHHGAADRRLVVNESHREACDLQRARDHRTTGDHRRDADDPGRPVDPALGADGPGHRSDRNPGRRTGANRTGPDRRGNDHRRGCPRRGGAWCCRERSCRYADDRFSGHPDTADRLDGRPTARLFPPREVHHRGNDHRNADNRHRDLPAAFSRLDRKSRQIGRTADCPPTNDRSCRNHRIAPHLRDSNHQDCSS